jgi:hypothetical protein
MARAYRRTSSSSSAFSSSRGGARGAVTRQRAPARMRALRRRPSLPSSLVARPMVGRLREPRRPRLLDDPVPLRHARRALSPRRRMCADRSGSLAHDARAGDGAPRQFLRAGPRVPHPSHQGRSRGVAAPPPIGRGTRRGAGTRRAPHTAAQTRPGNSGSAGHTPRTTRRFPGPPTAWRADRGAARRHRSCHGSSRPATAARLRPPEKLSGT